MAIHWVGAQGNVLVRLTQTPHFVVDQTHRADGAWVDCPSGRKKERSECEGCTRFRGWTQDAGDVPRVQCSWSELDPVEACMTPATRIRSVAPNTSCADAAALLAAHDFHHLPVLRQGALEGLVCGCDLARSHDPSSPVQDWMTREVLALRAGARIGEAVAAMDLCRIHFLPVIANGLLVGVITRTDLTRIGAPAKEGKRCG